jgi:peptide/nickel transport system substrate-binding protein
MLSYMDLGIVPKHVAEADANALAEKPVGTGPFKFVSWEKRNKIELEANKEYFRGAPYVDRIVVRSIPDNNVRVVGLESGDLDLIHSPVPPEDWQRLEKDSKYKVFKTNALGYTFLTLNVEDPILSDKRVRQAIAYLSDRGTIARSIFLDMDTPGLSPLIPGTWAYADQGMPKFDYNPNQAKQLLQEAGWTPGPGGVLQKDGKPFQVTLTTNVDPNRSQVLEYLQNAYQQAGIQADVKVYEWPSFLADVQQGKFQIALLGSLNLTDPDRAMYLHFRTGGPNNFARYSNPAVDELLEKGRATTSLDERKRIYADAARTIAEDVPRIFLLYQGYVVMYRSYLEGYVVNPTGSMKSVEKVWLNK